MSIHKRIALRAAIQADLPEMFRLTLEGLGEDFLARQISEEDEHPFQRHALRNGNIILAVDESSKPIGFIATIERQGTIFLAQLFVRDTSRAKGVGEATTRCRFRWYVRSSGSRGFG